MFMCGHVYMRSAEILEWFICSRGRIWDGLYAVSDVYMRSRILFICVLEGLFLMHKLIFWKKSACGANIIYLYSVGYSPYIHIFDHHHNSSENSMQRVQIPLNLYINWELKVLAPLDPAERNLLIQIQILKLFGKSVQLFVYISYRMKWVADQHYDDEHLLSMGKMNDLFFEKNHQKRDFRNVYITC